MFFRNLTFFRFPTTHDLAELDKGLEECRLKPVGPLELSSRGFISPFGRGDEDAVISNRIGSAIWLTVGGEDRLLPGAVINDMLAKKLAEIEQKEGRKPGGRTRKRLKDELITDLMPRAFIKPSRTDAIIDLEHGLVIVDTSSRKTAENVISEIRRAIGSFPALPLNAEVAPRSILTGWVAGEPLPDGIMLGDECELRDPVDQGAVVKCQRQELESDEIAKHLETGKQVTRLALSLDDHVSFVIGEDLIVRKFKLLDGAVDQLEHSDGDGLRAELDARFALMSAEVKRLFVVLEKALKLSKVEA
ncbi:recombination-associated protein RdgC [Lysobacter sp. K5869]|uniref:recombination-associated protein RdgC n=1 Tax=Lysobacter sp. K5869 TaxID=2820808 RepID=UPI001C05FA9F|nr:recombination-associated protein RdgC [Lysobacter sp. K5869]QWP77412.1 recombination-associated protein RdgC [Lysobacter sp. K5869]